MNAVLKQPTKPAHGPTGLPVDYCRLSWRADKPTYPVPKGYEREGEWSCYVEYRGGHASGDWVGDQWVWREVYTE